MKNNTLQNILILLFAGVACCLAYYIYSGQMPSTTDPSTEQSGSFMRTEAEFRDKLTFLNIEKNKRANTLKRLTAIKTKTVTELRAMGITSGADYQKTDDRNAKLKVLELQGTLNDIKKAETNIETYQSAIDRIRSMLAKFERERVSESAALTEAQAIELEEIVLDLDNKLEVKTDIFQDEELMKLLDLEMVE